MTDDYNPDRAFFGRRKGKALRDGQSALMQGTLPRLRLPEGEIADLPGLFAQKVTAVRLEIGFGGGEHLLARMRESPEIGFIGVEPFINGMAKFLAVIEREKLGNIRLWDGDAALMLPRLPEGSLDAIDLLYPDPWPKRRQRKRRFVSERTLQLFARALRRAGASALPATSTIMSAGPWHGSWPRRISTGRMSALTIGASPIPAGCGPATRPRRSKAGRVPSYITAVRRAF